MGGGSEERNELEGELESWVGGRKMEGETAREGKEKGEGKGW